MKLILACIIALAAYFLPMEQSESIEEIRLSSSTRGYSKIITLRPDLFSLKIEGKEGKETSRNATKAEWEQLVQALSGLPLNELDQLEPPSDKRASDRALHSTITIKTNKNEYSSRSFDNYSSPKQLVPLVEQIRELEKSLSPRHH